MHLYVLICLRVLHKLVSWERIFPLSIFIKEKFVSMPAHTADYLANYYSLFSNINYSGEYSNIIPYFRWFGSDPVGSHTFCSDPVRSFTFSLIWSGNFLVLLSHPIRPLFIELYLVEFVKKPGFFLKVVAFVCCSTIFFCFLNN